ncbi:MAG TPA: hypothetical protein VF153_01785 [Candidatus Limnocylindria bacterium]
MIGSARAPGGRLAGIAAALLLGWMLTLRAAPADAADPSLAASRAATLQRVSALDDGALAALIGQLQKAVDAGRRGSALVIQGETEPGPALEEAAQAAARAAELAVDSARADTTADGTWNCIRPAEVLPSGPSSSDLLGIDGQLRDAAADSGPFVARRRAAEQTLDAMRRALAALDADQPKAALAALDRAAAARATVANWPQPPLVLPFWLRTTNRMLHAARDIAKATLAGDVVAARQAGQAYERAANHARRADIALALAISESGAGLAAVPLRRLADALEAATSRRTSMASVLH